MKTIFVALFLLFNASNGQLIDIGTAAFEDERQCEASVAMVKQKASQDMLVSVEGGCMEVPLVAAN